MDDETAASVSQHFSGGIIFISYIIATVGAQTTLELLGRRTHIHGIRNWLLLVAAAIAMGGVGIWSMHFVGNNSLSLTYNETQYHLTYSAGYTFASLAVAIGCMFVAFAFVGVTEEARVSRIVPSGVIAGIGICCMHYIGQFAIEYFHVRYKIRYVAGAAIIACVAVVTALYIFFKLREKWANRWYKRLGSSLLMGVAVCGMHYTAMVGTEYTVRPSVTPDANPAISRGALIGTISAIVVVACGLLLFSAVRASVVYLPAISGGTSSHRLVLDAVLFDSTGKILVNVDGRVPSREIVPDFELKSTIGEFNPSHPLFLRLFEASHGWTKHDPAGDNRPSEQSSIRTRSPEDLAESAFVEAARELATELRFGSLADLGILFDGVISTNSISARRNHLFAENTQQRWRWWKRADGRHPTKDRTSATMLQKATRSRHPHSELKRLSSINSFDTFESAVALEHGRSSNHQPETKCRRISFHSFAEGCHQKKRSMEEGGQTTTTIDTSCSENRERPLSGSTARSSDAHNADHEDRHVALVRQISKKEQSRLLSQGYRFGDPVFISKTMGEHLKIPSDHMGLYFKDMQLLAQSATSLLRIQRSGSGGGSSAASATVLGPASPNANSAASFVSEDGVIPDRATKGAVYVGLAIFFQEDKENDPNHTHIMVDKMQRNAFPMVKLGYDDGEIPVQLSRAERNSILSLEGHTLQSVCSDEGLIQLPRESDGSSLVDGGGKRRRRESNSPTMASPISAAGDDSSSSSSGAINRFIRALQCSSRELMGKSVYGKPLASLAKLRGEVLDIPPFSLTLGPCQLILFRAWVTSPGTVSAINQTSHEATKCIPTPLYRSLAYYITDQAVLIYKAMNLRNVPESAYVTQQQVYQSTASSHAPPQQQHHPLRPPPAFSLPPLPPPQQHQPNDEKTSDDTTKQPTKRLSEFVSLPPPPRSRKPKIQLPPGGGLSLASLEDMAERIRRNPSTAATATPFAAAVELPSAITILSTPDRFWWLSNVIDETMHGG
ncbi:hypothetical protein BX666DRAFT_2021895 [Dichotomocladium elegans]|nr:hypothetical protein BX666DRAFT_2021895 [Dichotomocladium elegans]